MKCLYAPSYIGDCKHCPNKEECDIYLSLQYELLEE